MILVRNSKVTQIHVDSPFKCCKSCSFVFRESAMLSVVETKPVESARCLIPAFYDKNNPLDTR